MSTVCTNCGHENQEDAFYCDECGEELTANHSAEETAPVEELENKDGEMMSEETELDTALQSQEIEIAEQTEETEEEVAEAAEAAEVAETAPPLPIGTATRLEIDEPPKEAIVSPPTTLELPELPTAVLTHQETEARFVLPQEEKTAYIGRINDEFPVQIDLSSIPDADLISRVHAAIHLDEENYYLEDAGSANGTWLNGTQIQSGTRFRQQLNPGDTIAFGRNQTVKFTFDLED